MHGTISSTSVKSPLTTICAQIIAVRLSNSCLLSQVTRAQTIGRSGAAGVMIRTIRTVGGHALRQQLLRRFCLMFQTLQQDYKYDLDTFRWLAPMAH